VKAVLHIDLDEDNLDITIREILMSKLKKQDKEQTTLPDKKVLCSNCGKSIAKVVADFCLNNQDRFKSKVYCRDCQGEF